MTQAPPTEAGWVVARGETARPQYLTVTRLGFDWTAAGGAGQALRFFRRQDAERALSVFASGQRVQPHPGP